MQIILLERVKKLGFMGDVVNVKPGFARNFLLPQRKALRASKKNLSLFETQKKHYAIENIKLRSEADKIFKKMEKLKIIIIRHAGANGHLYGSVGARDISEAITKSGFSIKRSQVLIDAPIKNIGIHKAIISLHPEVEIKINLNIAKNKEEAELQEKHNNYLHIDNMKKS